MRRMNTEHFQEESKKPQPAATGCSLVVNAILAYIFYGYAYNNPDNSICVASESSVEVATQFSAYGDVNVTDQMILWFKMGFFLNCFGML